MIRISLTVNGEVREAEVWEGESLLYSLREHLGLPGSKNACEQGECGSCSVLLDGELVCACLVLAAQADGHEVVTVEDDEIREALSGNLCRCTGYAKIFDAVRLAASG